jgi:hypothetical protein
MIGSDYLLVIKFSSILYLLFHGLSKYTVLSIYPILPGNHVQSKS